jgi:hypothetical protein
LRRLVGVLCQKGRSEILLKFQNEILDSKVAEILEDKIKLIFGVGNSAFGNFPNEVDILCSYYVEKKFFQKGKKKKKNF